MAALALGLALAGCGGGEEVSPLPETVQGTVEKPRGAPGDGQTARPKGDPAAGKTVFTAQGCGGCHTYEPAGTNGKTGPNLDELPQLAEQADQGSLEEFTRESLVNPNEYVEEGFPPVMPSYEKLSDKQLNDLVAFLTAR